MVTKFYIILLFTFLLFINKTFNCENEIKEIEISQYYLDSNFYNNDDNIAKVIKLNDEIGSVSNLVLLKKQKILSLI